LTSKAK
jgi:enoyl-[acyl-carrier protein] reductase I